MLEPLPAMLQCLLKPGCCSLWEDLPATLDSKEGEDCGLIPLDTLP